MSKYRIKQEGAWFYPQKRRLGFWGGIKEIEFGTGELYGEEVFFTSLESARKWLDNHLRPIPKEPKPIFHPYP